MGCVKLSILDEQFKQTELKVSSYEKELTPIFFVKNERRVIRYAYCLFNPLKYTDPTGYFFGDYVDRFNNYLGNDGIFDGKVYLVTDFIDVNKILLNDILQKTTPLSEVRSAIDLRISQDLRFEMLFKSITFDTPNNLQEWGGIAKRYQNETNYDLVDYIDWGELGPVWQGEPTATFRFSTCQGRGEFLAFFHLHFQGNFNGKRVSQFPSAGFPTSDLTNIQTNNAMRNALNLVISVKNSEVYIMHGDTWTTMSFGDFWGAKNTQTPKR